MALFQFSLRSLLIIVFIAAILLGGVVMLIRHREERYQQAVRLETEMIVAQAQAKVMEDWYAIKKVPLSSGPHTITSAGLHIWQLDILSPLEKDVVILSFEIIHEGSQRTFKVHEVKGSQGQFFLSDLEAELMHAKIKVLRPQPK